MAKRKEQTDDAGYKKTDEQLEDLEARLSSLYTDASKDMENKLGDFLSQYKEKDEQKRALVKEGKMSEDEYIQWRNGQIFQTKKMQAQVDNLTETLVNTDKLAMQMVNGELPSVYANNYNFQGYKAEKMAQAGGEDFSSFTIYNADAVSRLAKTDPDLLPAPKVDIPKDTKWNKTKINTAISQGIIQGESMDKIAARLIDVTDMDYNAAIRNARTAVIGAQNAGRKDASERVKEAGFEMVDVWSATYDQRTRDTHIMLDGQERQPDGYFHTFTGERLAYPCDPNGAPAEVYNCRCRLNSIIKSIDHSKDDELYAEFMEENYYDDWLVVKEQNEEKKELFDKNKEAIETKLAGAESDQDGMSESLKESILAYTAQGGQYASDHPFTSDKRDELSEYVNETAMVTDQTLYRGLDYTEKAWNDMFNRWYNDEEVKIDMKDINSFSSEKARTYGFGGTGKHVTLILPEGSEVHGANIEEYSMYQEKETLIGGLNDEFKISNIEFTSSGQPLVYIEKIEEAPAEAVPDEKITEEVAVAEEVPRELTIDDRVQIALEDLPSNLSDDPDVERYIRAGYEKDYEKASDVDFSDSDFDLIDKAMQKGYDAVSMPPARSIEVEDPKPKGGYADSKGFEKDTKEWLDSITKAEKKEVVEYTEETYGAMNWWLRDGGQSKELDERVREEYPDIEKRVERLDSAIDKFDLKEDITVYRVLDPEYNPESMAVFENLGKGDVIHDNAYSSTSTGTHLEGLLEGNIVLEIEVPAGQGRGAYVDDISKAKGQKEFLLARNSDFEVMDIRQEGDLKIYHVKML